MIVAFRAGRVGQGMLMSSVSEGGGPSPGFTPSNHARTRGRGRARLSFPLLPSLRALWSAPSPLSCPPSARTTHLSKRLGPTPYFPPTVVEMLFDGLLLSMVHAHHHFLQRESTAHKRTRVHRLVGPLLG